MGGATGSRSIDTAARGPLHLLAAFGSGEITKESYRLIRRVKSFSVGPARSRSMEGSPAMSNRRVFLGSMMGGAAGVAMAKAGTVAERRVRGTTSESASV